MKVTKKVLGVVATLLVIVALFSIPTATAFADDPYLDVNIPSARTTDKDIEAMNRHMLEWLVTQNQAFRDGYQLETNFFALIDASIAKRGEAPELEIGLGRYATALRIAQAVQDDAATVLGAQWGFDANGHVLNRTAALETVTSGRYSLRDARYRLLIAIHALHRSYIDWRRQFIPNLE